MTSLAPRLDQLERNLIINGNFDFWQRFVPGVTSQSITTSQYVADRTRTFNNGTFSGVGTVSQSTDVPTVAQSGFQSRYSFLITKSAGAISPASTDYLYHSHKIEGQDYAQIHGAKNIRLQFWVKSNITGIYSVGLTNSASTRGYAAEYTILAANTWEKKTLDIVTDNSGTWLFDTGVGLELGFSLSQGSNYRISPGAWTPLGGLGIAPCSTNQVNWAQAGTNTFYLAQIMLIPQNFLSAVASTADIPFARAGHNIARELQMCQRYFFSRVSDSNTGSLMASGGAVTTGQILCGLSFPVTMRSTPTFAQPASLVALDFRIDGFQFVATPGNLPTIAVLNPQGALVYLLSGTTLTLHGHYYILSNTGSLASLNFTAEL